MFKFTQVFLLLEMLVATAQGTDLRFAGNQQSLADLKSDFTALQDRVQDLQDLVQDLRTSLREQTEKSPPSQDAQRSWSPTAKQSKVAFFVGLLTKSIGPVTHNTDLVFDAVVTNIGSAYSAWSGRFTALFSATYQFSVTIAAAHTKAAAVDLLKNGVIVMTITSVATPSWAPSSNVAILSLNAGDQVWLQLRSGASIVYGGMDTTFSGFLIFEN